MDRPRSSPDRSPGLSRLTFQPLHLHPPHCHFVTVALARYFSAVTCRVYPPGQTIQVEGMAVAQSRVRSSPGASPTGLAESSSLALRMGRSSQVALHLSSRKRSYHCRLQAGNVSLEGTCTLLIKRLHRRTGSGIPARDSRSVEPRARQSRPRRPCHNGGHPRWMSKPVTCNLQPETSLAAPPAAPDRTGKKLWVPFPMILASNPNRAVTVRERDPTYPGRKRCARGTERRSG